MANKFHKDLIGDDLHISKTNVGSSTPVGNQSAGVIGEFFWDSTNNKLYIAEATGTGNWIFAGGENDEWIELTDTPSSITALLSVQGNAGGTALEFGQNLTTTGSPQFSGMDFTSTIAVLRLPRLTTTQRDALTPLAGMTIFNITTSQVEDYNGTAWVGATAADEWTELSDTPSSITADLVVQGNSGGTALEFGQALKTTSTPTFAGLTVAGTLTVTGTGTHNFSGKIAVNDIINKTGDDLNLTSSSAFTLNAATVEIDSTGAMDITTTTGAMTIASGGTGTMTLDPGSGVLSVDGLVRSTNGTELLPAYSFTSDTATGMRLSATNILNLSARGFDVLQLTAPTSSVNFMTTTASATGSDVILGTSGTDTNIGLKITTQGSGALDVDADIVITTVDNTAATLKFEDSGTTQVEQQIYSFNGITEWVTKVDNNLSPNEMIFMYVPLGSNEIMRLISGAGANSIVAGVAGVGINKATPAFALDVVGDIQVTGAFRDTSGDPGTSGQVLSSTVTGTNWIAAGVGDVIKVGTPVDNQVGVWTGDGTLEGTTAFTFDDTTLALTGAMTVTGNLTVDTNTLFVDATNNRVGIGTLTPDNMLSVVGNMDMGDADTPTKAYRFRTSGSELDFEGGGANMFLGVFANADFTGTQHDYIEMSNSGADMKIKQNTDFQGKNILNINTATISGNLTVDTNTLFVDATNNEVGIGTITPHAKLHVKSSGTASSVASFASEFAIENSGDVGMNIIAGDSSNAHLIFRNQSDNNSATIRYRSSGEIFETFVGTANIPFTIMGSGALMFNTDMIIVDTNGNVAFGTTSPDTKLHVLSTAADTTAVVTTESTGTNLGEFKTFVGSRDPSGNITGAGGDEYYRDSADTSGSYESKEATTGTSWFRRSVNSSVVIELNTSGDFNDLASGGIVTVSTDTTFILKANIVTSNRIVVNSGITLQVSGADISTAIFIYTGTDTFLTIAGSFRAQSGSLWVSTSTGTFMDFTSTGTFNFSNGAIIGWDNLGTQTGGTFINTNMNYVNIDSGWTITDSTRVSVLSAQQSGTTLTGSLYTIKSKVASSVYNFTDVTAATLNSTGSIFDFDTRIDNGVSYNIQNSSATIGTLFKQTTVTNATINSVADGTISNGSITAQASNGDGGTTHSSTTTYFEDEEVTITGTTSYNGDFQIFNVVAGVSFDTITAFVADDATGTVATVRLTITLAAGHGISTSDSLKIILTQFYNGFETALNIATNTLTVNGTFIATETGSIEINVGLDETDPRISAFNNPGFSDSDVLAFGFTNANSTATTITDGTYVAIDVSTFTQNQSTERFKLTNSTTASFELTALEDFDGFLTGSLSALKSGSTSDYRFAMSTNGALPVFASANYVPMEVKTTKVNIALEFNVSLTKGDTVQIMVAGDGTSDNLTITDLVFGIK